MPSAAGGTGGLCRSGCPESCEASRLGDSTACLLSPGPDVPSRSREDCCILGGSFENCRYWTTFCGGEAMRLTGVPVFASALLLAGAPELEFRYCGVDDVPGAPMAVGAPAMDQAESLRLVGFEDEGRSERQDGRDRHSAFAYETGRAVRSSARPTGEAGR